MTSVNPPEIDTPSLFNNQHITDREVQECPWPYYAAMHEVDGFYFDEKLNMFVCANYKLMREILRDTKRYSNVHSQDVSQMRVIGWCLLVLSFLVYRCLAQL